MDEKTHSFALEIDRYKSCDLFAYHLDTPINKYPITSKSAELIYLELRGWVLSDKNWVTYIREKNEFTYIENKKRPDVIKHHKDKFTNTSVDVGFSIKHTLKTAKISLGVKIGDIHHELWQIRIVPKQKIIKVKMAGYF